MNDSKESSFIWYPVTYYNKGEYQPESSFNERNMAIDFCTSAIDYYAELQNVLEYVLFQGVYKLGVLNTLYYMRYLQYFVFMQHSKWQDILFNLEGNTGNIYYVLLYKRI